MPGSFCFYPELRAVREGSPRTDLCILCNLHKFRRETLVTLTIDFCPKVWYTIIVKGGTSCGEINLQAMEIGNLGYNKRTETKGLGRKVSEIKKIVANIF